MVDLESRTFAELRARIQQTVQDLEDHCRTVPAAQRRVVKGTIGRLKQALDEEQAIHGSEPQ
jgi:hypothetical protein